MLTHDDVVAAWDEADPQAIHPSRGISEEAYWASGEEQAHMLTAGLRALGLDGGRILDYGCGDGRVAIPMAALGWEVIAADTSPNMRGRLRQNDADEVVRVVAADELPTDVDAAYCLAVLIHHDRQSTERILQQVRDAVRVGGLLVIDWQVSSRPRERAFWIDVTTWSTYERSVTARRLSLQQVDTNMPWSTYRRLT